MAQHLSAPQFKSITRSLVLKFSIPIVIIALALGAFVVLRAHPIGSVAATPASVPTNAAIEDRWGLRVSMVGATADGGLVDFRFVVLDPDKVSVMLQDENSLPTMVAEDSGTLINSTALMAHRHDFNAGETYFLLYRNTEGAIKEGTPVTVKFGDLKLEHIVAQ